MNKLKLLVFIFVMLNVSLQSGCITNNIADVNVSMPKHRWSYINKITTIVDVKDHTKTYDLFFKLRHTAKYKYSNIFVLFHFKGPDQKKITRRYEFKLAAADGQWLGAGSGDLYTSVFPLLTKYHFPAAGKYELVIEQSMRDNPLSAISDAGIMVSLEEGQSN